MTGCAIPDLGIELAPVVDWLVDAELGVGPLRDVQALSGGTQNILLRLAYGDADLVLRHPPRHKRPESDSVILREIRVLEALGESRVPVPRLRAASPDPGILGSVCYVTDFIEGFNPAEGLPHAFAQRLEWQRDLGLQMADALVALAAVPVTDFVAAGFRSPDGWLERQPARWLEQLAGYETGDLVEQGTVLSRWLTEHRPTIWQKGLIHGDYHLGNILVRPDEPRLAAVVDWELATLGDPLLDLAHLLVGWPVGNPHSSHADLDAPGLPGRGALLERYIRSGGEVHDLDWYGVLAAFRLGVLLEGTYARSRRGLATPELGARFHGLATHLFDRAKAISEGEPLV
ncbi:phosphotransferase family protein [Nocardia fusca]|uniref:phosphotransferase family protein n=1 Tax=Nocardia fusca TaxID=941183 RepID=UPI0007A747F3|nr:phosphotransferase family protein [Nocardia fusca]